MITITDIVGESINLRNGRETPRGLLITNGISTALIHVSDDDLEKVIQMWGESRSYQAEVQIQNEVEDPSTVPTAPPPSASAPPMFNPDRDVEDEDDFDAGESYGGVPSV
jgi:hypothetical protein